MNTSLIMPTLEQLAEELDIIKNEVVDKIPGVIIFDSGKPGPVIGITAMTHGNEPSGLACIWHYRRAGNLKERLIKGKVIIVLNNLEASVNYFNSVLHNKKEQAKLHRLKDLNMNRLPNDLLETEQIYQYEVRRARELRPIWNQFDVALDIHSTSQENPPMIVAVGRLFPEMFKGFPIEIILSNYLEVGIGKPASYFYGKIPGTIPAMVIESGFHENSTSFKVAIECVEKLLKNTEVIDIPQNERESKQIYLDYRISGSFRVPNSSYKLDKVFKPFELVRKGTVLAHGDQGDITIPTDSLVIFCKGSVDITEKDVNEEIMFYIEPAKEIIV